MDFKRKYLMKKKNRFVVRCNEVITIAICIVMTITVKQL